MEKKHLKSLLILIGFSVLLGFQVTFATAQKCSDWVGVVAGQNYNYDVTVENVPDFSTSKANFKLVMHVDSVVTGIGYCRVKYSISVSDNRFENYWPKTVEYDINATPVLVSLLPAWTFVINKNTPSKIRGLPETGQTEWDENGVLEKYEWKHYSADLLTGQFIVQRPVDWTMAYVYGGIAVAVAVAIIWLLVWNSKRPKMEIGTPMGRLGTIGGILAIGGGAVAIYPAYLSFGAEFIAWSLWNEDLARYGSSMAKLGVTSPLTGFFLIGIITLSLAVLAIIGGILCIKEKRGGAILALVAGITFIVGLFIPIIPDYLIRIDTGTVLGTISSSFSLPLTVSYYYIDGILMVVGGIIGTVSH